jgi:tRNA A-37 threonylcarbamoyl transferase component Bud32
MAVCPTCNSAYDPSVRICPKDGSPLPLDPVADGNVGTMLESKYRVDAFISAGGMGSVYRGTHVMLDKTVAIKLIRKELVTSPDVASRFQREARAASNLGHPNIAAVHDFGQTPEGTLYLVMEHINGPSLRDVIHRGGPMPPERIVAILKPIAAALSKAHRHQVIHRDLKPHNIMLAIDAEGHETPKLLDFGIAKTFDDSASQLTMTGFALGTPQYMSPEQATGRVVDGRSDIYSFGVVLYEMLIGEVPFSDTSLAGVLLKQMTEVPVAPSLRRPDLQISPTLEAVAMRCLEKDPGNRYPSADDVLAALEHALPVTAGAGSALPFRVPVGTGEPTVSMPRGAAAPEAPVAPATASGRTGTTPTIVAPVQAAGPQQPAVAAPRSSGAVWVPTVAVAALLLLALGVWGLRRPATPPPNDVVAAGPPEIVAPASIPASAPPDKSTAPPPASTQPTSPAQSPTASTPRETGATRRTSTSMAAAPPVRAVSPPDSAPTRVAAQPQQQPASGVAQVPAPRAGPENPAVFVQCDGPGEVCAPMRSAFQDALVQGHMPMAASAGRADVVLSVTVDVVEERATQSFGTTFLTRTYSAEVSGDAKGAPVPMPSGRTFSFDARVGRERANENARLLASDATERVRAFWDKAR